MPFKNDVYYNPPIGGDVAGIAIKTSLALDSINKALSKLSEKAGVDIDTDIEDVRKLSKQLELLFDELSGWYPADE